MPEISRFYGIVIQIYDDDHPPPHFHALYGGVVVVIAIETSQVLGGSLPRRASLWSSMGPEFISRNSARHFRGPRHFSLQATLLRWSSRMLAKMALANLSVHHGAERRAR